MGLASIGVGNILLEAVVFLLSRNLDLNTIAHHFIISKIHRIVKVIMKEFFALNSAIGISFIQELFLSLTLSLGMYFDPYCTKLC